MAAADPPFTAIAFPDEGAQKRFSSLFGKEWPVVTCGKTRRGAERIVVIQDTQLTLISWLSDTAGCNSGYLCDACVAPI